MAANILFFTGLKEASKLGGVLQNIILLCFVVFISYFGWILGKNTHYNLRIPLNADVSMVSLPFIYFGWVFQEYLHRSMKEMRLQFKLLAVTLLFGLLYILYKYNLPVSDYGTDYVAMAFSTYGNMLLFYFNALLGVGGVVLLAMILEAINALKQIGQRTITILVIHGQIQFLFQLFWDLLKETYGITVNAMLKCFICVLAVLVISIPFDYILRKFVPNLIGK